MNFSGFNLDLDAILAALRADGVNGPFPGEEGYVPPNQVPIDASAPEGTFNNPIGGYVRPIQALTPHTGSRTSVERDGTRTRVGIGGGIPVPIEQQNTAANSVLARPDLQIAQRPEQLALSAPENFNRVTPVTVRNAALASALRSSGGTGEA